VREAADLTPLPDDDLPEEVQPLVQEINLLFGRLSQSFDAQRAFLANAAHELRSPLTALKLQAQALARTSDPQAREQAVARLNQGVDRAIRLMQQLLVLARQESALPDSASWQSVDLRALLAQVVQDLLPQAQSRSISLALEAEATASVHGDADGLQILLRNLTENAIKYTPEQGRVRLRIARHNAVTRVVVEDSGPGIAPAQRERMFERFVRADDAPGTGSGLGLSIAKAIAERHGAGLTLGHSADLGGLSVRLEFPVPPN